MRIREERPVGQRYLLQLAGIVVCVAGGFTTYVAQDQALARVVRQLGNHPVCIDEDSRLTVGVVRRDAGDVSSSVTDAR
jgi:hypothetical protein